MKAIRATEMYTPYWKTMTVFTPGPQGGTNWQPSSYNPNTHLFYVCAQSGVTGNTADAEQPATKQGDVAQVALGGTLTIAGGFGENMGTFSAIDVTTGKIVWQKKWPESCYAGSTTTKGNIVFIGRNDGRLLAFNATNGNPLWSFQTGAGANDAPTIFEHNGTRVRRVLRGRQRARRLAARRQPLALLARRPAERARGARRGHRRRARRRHREDAAEDGWRRQRARPRPRRPARSSSRTTARRATARRARAATAAPT